MGDVLRVFLYALTASAILASTSMADEAKETKRPFVRVVTGGYEAMRAVHGAKLEGQQVDTVRAYLDAKGVDYTITPMAWSRAYNLALSSDDVIIYPLTKTPEREDNFKWLLHVHRQSYTLIGHKKIDPLELSKSDILSGKYLSLCEANSVNCHFLAKYGFPQSSILRVHGVELDKILRLVSKGRASFMMEEVEEVNRTASRHPQMKGQFIPIKGTHFYADDYLAAYHLKPEIASRLKLTPNK